MWKVIPLCSFPSIIIGSDPRCALIEPWLWIAYAGLRPHTGNPEKAGCCQEMVRTPCVLPRYKRRGNTVFEPELSSWFMPLNIWAPAGDTALIVNFQMVETHCRKLSLSVNLKVYDLV